MICQKYLRLTAISNFRIPACAGMTIWTFSVLIYYKRLSENVVL
ncbi:putative membrane protein [Neisseria meningitidis H44/76]|uniref:Putative membrane protein n=1 Tax=Neisseria meningitidis serogroup B / serotype 15 (strain H44/76) TaxID=909420 RepID=E6MYI0_NEIMH|nr:putative membrane protein [Neisseria meningitidis H44/76]